MSMGRDVLATGGAGPGAHQLLVVLLTHDHPLKHADTVHDDLITYAAHMANTPEVLLTNGQVLVCQIFISHLLSTDLALE